MVKSEPSSTPKTTTASTPSSSATTPTTPSSSVKKEPVKKEPEKQKSPAPPQQNKQQQQQQQKEKKEANAPLRGVGQFLMMNQSKLQEERDKEQRERNKEQIADGGIPGFGGVKDNENRFRDRSTERERSTTPRQTMQGNDWSMADQVSQQRLPVKPNKLLSI